MKKTILLALLAIFLISQTAFAVESTPPVAKVAAGGGHNAAIMTDGTLWAWGNNKYGGQLGDGTAWKETPIRITMPFGKGAQ